MDDQDIRPQGAGLDKWIIEGLMSNSDHPRCKNLCCKSMLVYSENFAADPEYQAGLTDSWCIRTAKGQGPDEEHVSLPLCSNPERSCYEPY